MNLTISEPTATATALTPGVPTSILVSGGKVILAVQHDDDSWVDVAETRSPGVTIPVLPGTQVRGTLIGGPAATVTVSQG